MSEFLRLCLLVVLRRSFLALLSLGVTAAVASGQTASATATAEPTGKARETQLQSSGRAKDAGTISTDQAKQTTTLADYRIAPGDLLEVDVFGVPELKRVVRVSSAGQVTLPLVGAIPVSGLSPADAEVLIGTQYGEKYLQSPQISVFVREYTLLRFTMDGAVIKPGIYPLLGPVTLLRALATAGGGAPMADLENVMLFRLMPDGRTQSQKFNVDKLRAGEQSDPLLQADDLVVVNRDARRTAFRDSLFRDIIDAINPFSGAVRNITAP